jgi:hypothetical protein
MIYIDQKFSGKTIVCGLNEDNIKEFLRNLIKHVWMDHDIPDGMRYVGSGTKLTLDMLPNNFNLEQVADRAADKHILMLERIGPVGVYLNLWITKDQGTNPNIKVDIDKFNYESDGNNLNSVVNKAIQDTENK